MVHVMLSCGWRHFFNMFTGLFISLVALLSVPFACGVRHYLHNHSIPIEVYLSQKSVPNSKQFKVALVTAGSIRSFLFVERSWQRYIIGPWKDNIHIFAHVVAPHAKCEISNKGIDALREIATEFEVGYTTAPLLSYEEVGVKLGKTRSCLSIARSEGMKSGNILDMYARRAKAYHMAKYYAGQNSITWSLVMFIRLDSAFYAPKLELLKYHAALLNLTSMHSPTIIMPYACGFSGYCDRFAVGLPKEMDVYFDPDQLYKAVDWAFAGANMVNHTDTKQVSSHKFHLQHSRDCGSELMLFVWLKYVHNITQGNTVPYSMTFITLRSSFANHYCASTRGEVSQNPGLGWTDKSVSWRSDSPAHADFDLIASPYERCGNAYKLNVTNVCKSKHCQCGHKDR